MGCDSPSAMQETNSQDLKPPPTTSNVNRIVFISYRTRSYLYMVLQLSLFLLLNPSFYLTPRGCTRVTKKKRVLTPGLHCLLLPQNKKRIGSDEKKFDK